MKVCFETFGCRLNRAEALEQEGVYLSRGWEITRNHKEANCIIVRGCSVTARAQHDCEKLIAHLKRRYPLTQLIVEGCLPSKLKTPKNLRRDLPTHTSSQNLDKISTRTARAYLKVQDGCSGTCTFCIVPQFRGSSRSVPFGEVLDKAKRFIDVGYHEIVVTGCNLSLYASEGKRLPDLLAALAALAPTTRIRLGSLEPGRCAHETISVMAETPNICRFLHVPIQSGSNIILNAMKRPYTIQEVDELLEKAVDLLPTIGLGCDLMTGFPGEQNPQFLATKGLLKRHPFSNVHVFPYSARPNTLAAGFPQAVSRSLAHERARILIRLAAQKKMAFARTFLGKKVEIVCESAESGKGWTGEYLACRTNAKLVRKELVQLHIIKVHHDATLEGARLSH